jgi:hypothetical protein
LKQRENASVISKVSLAIKGLTVTGKASPCHESEDDMVILPGFQKGRDIKASQGKGQGPVLAKEGQFAPIKKKKKKIFFFFFF